MSFGDRIGEDAKGGKTKAAIAHSGWMQMCNTIDSTHTLAPRWSSKTAFVALNLHSDLIEGALGRLPEVVVGVRGRLRGTVTILASGVVCKNFLWVVAQSSAKSFVVQLRAWRRSPECWEKPSLRRRAQVEPPVRHG